MSKIKGIIKSVEYLSMLKTITSFHQALQQLDKKRLTENTKPILVKKPA